MTEAEERIRFDALRWEELVEFLQDCPGRFSAAVVPAALSGDALVRKLRGSIPGLSLATLIPVDPAQAVKEAVVRESMEAVLLLRLDNRRRFPSGEAAAAFWKTLNLQREQISPGRPRTLLLLSEESDAQMIRYADDLRDWVRIFRFPESIPPPVFRVPPPPRFQVRRRIEAQLKEALVGVESRESIDRDRRSCVALYGPPGIGKTSVAASLSHDESVRKRFRDGIVWLTLGPNPDVADLQERLSTALGEAGPPQLHTGETTLRLRDLLAPLRFLLVLDDVREKRHLAALDVVGPNGTLLVMTRESSLLGYPGMDPTFGMGVLDDEERWNLLAEWSGLGRESLPPEAESIVREGERKPLVLAAAGAAIRCGTTWGNVVLLLKKAQIRDWEAVHWLIEHNLRNLSPEDQALCIRLLAIPDESPMPVSTVALLWELDVDETRRKLTELAERALLTLSGWEEERRVSLRPDQRAVFQDFVLPAVDRSWHEHLLEGWRKIHPSGWHSGPDDEYFFSHLSRLLREAGQTDELRNLLLDPKWMRARLEKTGVQGLMNDYQNAPPDDEDAKVVEDALRLSAHILARDPAQLPSQLLGRLPENKSERLESLRKQIVEMEWGYPWARPIRPSMDMASWPLVLVLDGHDGAVTSLVVSDDGRLCLTGSADQRIRRWNLESGQCEWIFEGHTETVLALAIIPNSVCFLSGSADGTLRLWDVDTGECLISFEGHNDGITSVIALPGSRYAVSGSWDGTLRRWDIEEEKSSLLETAHSKGILCLEILPDGKRFLSGAEDGTVALWDTETAALLSTFQLANGFPISLRARPASTTVYVGLSTGAIAPLDWNDGSVGKEFLLHREYVESLAHMRVANRLLAASVDTMVVLWNTETGSGISQHKREFSSGSIVETIPNGNSALVSFDERVELWDLDRWVASSGRTIHEGAVEALTVSPDGKSVLSVSSDGTACEWNPMSGSLLGSYRFERNGVCAVEYLPGGGELAVGFEFEHIRIWNCKSRNWRKSFSTPNHRICALFPSPDGHRLISGAWDGPLREWDIETGECLRAFGPTTGECSSMRITSDGRQIVIGGWSGNLEVLDFDTGNCLHSFPGEGSSVISIGALWEVTWVITGQWDGSVRLWNLDSGENIVVFKSDAPANAVAVDSKDRRVFVGDGKGRVHFLDMQGVRLKT